MRKIKAEIIVECGSDFQVECVKQMLTCMGLGVKISAENQHKKNSVTYGVEEL